MRITTLPHAILTALAYADIFSYPLTSEELLYWLPFQKKIKTSAFQQTLKTLVKKKRIEQTGNFFTLPKKGGLVPLRQKRAKSSEKKLFIARRAASLIAHIPSVLFIGLTGGMAMGNATKNDDIDFLIVTAKNTLWTTRFFTTILLDIVGMRRKPNDIRVVDKICLNMFLDERTVSEEKKNRDMYTAHEILQIKPIIDKNFIGTHMRRKNAWVYTFFPHAKHPFEKNKKKYEEKRKNIVYSIALFQLVEPFLRTIQTLYMQKRKTTEYISSTILRFHPRDMRQIIKNKLVKQLEYLNIPLDKSLFHS